MIWISRAIFAQDIQFSQFYASSTYLNPALVGSKMVSRAMSHSRIQWPGLEANYVSTYASFDTPLPKYNSSLGVVLLHDRQGQGTYTSNEIKFQYAFVFNPAPNVAVSTGLEIGYIQKTLRNDLIFPDQYDQITQTFTGNTEEDPFFDPVGSTDFGSGIVIYTPQFWLGASTNHINRPVQSYLQGFNRLPIRFVIASGYRFNIKGHPHYWVTPTLQYKAQGKSDQFEMGVHVLLDQAMFGTWYRGIPFKRYNNLQNNESIIAMIGYKFKQHFQVSYSYDIVVSRLAFISYGAHELNVTYTLNHLDSHQKSLRHVICPPKKAIY